MQLKMTVAAAAILALGSAHAQWTNHYPKLADFGHHVYLEQHELPVFAGGLMGPAEAPDGEELAFASKGWIWILDLETGTATRLTDGPHMDARPRWSPDGGRLAFVRDTGTDTEIVVLDRQTGREEIINTPTIELDPEFSSDGDYLYYSSSAEGRMNLWRRHLGSGVDEQMTDLRQVVRNPRALPGGEGLLYLHGAGAQRSLRLRDFLGGSDDVVVDQTLTYHLTADVHPTERLAAFIAPTDGAQHLYTVDLDQPGVRSRLTEGDAFALNPSFSADGDSIYYTALSDDRQFEIMRMPTYGGTSERVTVDRWDYGQPTGTLRIALQDADGEPVTARVAITDADGHPVANPVGATYADPQTGRRYFYIDEELSLDLPRGRYEITAVRGPMTSVVTQTVSVRPRREASVSLELTPVWNAEEAGYAAADYHVHLNGDGHQRATHEDALTLMAGEDLHTLAPMSWNRWERRVDAPLIDKQTSEDGRTVWQGQEVRSHFHGHVGLLGNDTAFTPWFFGPSNPILGNPDLTNGDVVAFAEENGAFATYVHPLSRDGDAVDIFTRSPHPLELISDGVLSDRLGLEIVCAWTSPLANSSMWYRFLNIGKPMAAMSGTDGWVDFHRTPAMGTGRNYVRTTDGRTDPQAMLDAATEGRGFVTTGPALLFEVADARPGDTVASGEVPWRATLAAAMDVDVLEIVVNGEVVDQLEGVTAGDTRTFEGTVILPNGGWVAARAYTEEKQDDAWPTMHARPFAHSSPIWIDTVGSTDTDAQSAAASDLLLMLNAAEAAANRAYDDELQPSLQARFDEARSRLSDLGATPSEQADAD